MIQLLLCHIVSNANCTCQADHGNLLLAFQRKLYLVFWQSEPELLPI